MHNEYGAVRKFNRKEVNTFQNIQQFSLKSPALENAFTQIIHSEQSPGKGMRILTLKQSTLVY